jgi:hypothetical protein
MTADHLAHIEQLSRLRREVESALDDAARRRLAGEAREVLIWLERLGALLHARQDADLSVHRDIGTIRRGVAAARAAVVLEPGRRALEEVKRMLVEPDGAIAADVLVKAMVVHLRIGNQLCAAALPALVEAGLSEEEGGRAVPGTPASREQPGAPKVRDGHPSLHLEVLRSVAAYHREHERYYTMNGLEQAAQMSRDANRLKVIADAWLGGATSAPPTSVDYADPRHQAAGCEDLNALPAIAAIGVLFMEGEGEPAEIRTLRTKLRGTSLGFRSAGQWLADKMAAAWERERVLFSADLIDAAWPRFQTIVTNWSGARRTAVAGRLLELAEEFLATIEFTPAAVRRHRAASGQALRTAGWVLDLAAQLLAETAADLANNDPRWTEYRAILDRVAKSDLG